MRFFRVCRVVLTLSLLLPALARAQGLTANLENPASDSFQSGIGVLSGWICDAQLVEVEFDGRNDLRFQVGYGTSRADTESVCGDANNGFGMTVNWNLLGDGQHQVRVLADGVEFANHTFKVTTLGLEVVTGEHGTYALAFPGNQFGDQLLIQWSQPLQNFVIVASSTDKGTFPLDDLLGQWDFSYTSNGTTVHEAYNLEDVDESEPEAIILGTDLQDSGLVIVGYVADLSSSPGPYNFFLTDPDNGQCQVFFFNVTGANTVEGIKQTAPVQGSCLCDPDAATGPALAMTGTRTAQAPLEATQLAPKTVLPR
ncbi:MAG: hypothetical protein AB7G75_17155 [Candidatus Binatia bacterium]